MDGYLRTCKNAIYDEELFANFKKDSYYTKILEHVTKEQSLVYLDNIIANNPELCYEIQDSFAKNDILGNPTTIEYTLSNNKKVNCSPTTIRYVKVLSDLISLYKDLNNLTILEIGGGYGGLATVINQKFSPKHYYNVDLEFPGKLAEKYTKKMNINNFTSITPDKVDQVGRIDLLISNYAFSECNLETRIEYINKLLNNSKLGYITHNGDNQRRQSTKLLIEHYKGFKIHGFDSRKKHPIYVWDKRNNK